MNQSVKKRIAEWTSAPFDGETINEVRKLVEVNDDKELMDRFHAMLEFGTGGLRGVLGAGTNRMNIYTVGMAAQGLANYIVKKGRSGDGVVVAYDSRRMSDLFKEEVASIMAGNGIRAYVFDDISPTPMCSFAIRELKAVSGIVITASHNPPEYNGFKAYWDDGGQVVPPQDKEIIDEVKAIDSIAEIKKIPYTDGIESGMISIIGEDILKSYIEKLKKIITRPAGESDIKIVYSPLHGTGYKIVPRVLAHFGFGMVITVKEQSVPDGNFSTVKSPNPEERAALEMSLDLARRENADIIMATDPDADRMGIGFKDENGDYLLINGNQIGTMLEYYLLTRMSAEGRLPAGSTVIKTIVTTDLQEEIARSFGCEVENVLTGFKWIALKMREYDEENNRTFIFGGEESYGYLPVDFVRDKDAVSACYFFAEMADWLKSKGMSLNDFLNEIYIKHHLYLEDLHSLTLKGMEGMEKIGAIMNALRKNPPREFAARAVTRLSDLKALTMKDMKTGSEHPMKVLPSSDVLQFFLEDGSKITMRPSGTEPKIKFYFSVKTKAGKEELAAAKQELKSRIEAMKKSLLDRISELQ